jgi:hypothetical protein
VRAVARQSRVKVREVGEVLVDRVDSADGRSLGVSPSRAQFQGLVEVMAASLDCACTSSGGSAAKPSAVSMTSTSGWRTGVLASPIVS